MAVNKVVMNTENGAKTLIDLTNDSVTPETLAEGETAHDASGERIVGTMPKDVVRYGSQTLTEAQKEQARENIGLGVAYKTQLMTEILEAIGCPLFGFVDENNNVVLSGDLSDGIYVLKYECENGTQTEIGELIIGEVITYTNLADPTSSEWKTNKRINSSKAEVDIPASSLNGETMVITNLIDITGATNSTKYHIKGLNLLATTGVGASYNRVYFYDESKAYKMYWQPSGAYLSNYVTVADYDENVQIFTNIQQLINGISELSGVKVKYITFGAVLTSTADDVVIAKDAQIV